jgi:hypothetical protein
MSFVTGFVVYGILFWFFIAMMVLIATRDHFSRPTSESGLRSGGRMPPKVAARQDYIRPGYCCTGRVMDLPADTGECGLALTINVVRQGTRK